MTDWPPELGDDDLATLIEALEAWEHKDDSSEMFGDILDVIMDEKNPQKRAAVQEARAAQKLEMKRKKDSRKERSVLLRAKLLTLRDRRRVDQVERSS